jgi:hypothetical protein
MADSQNQVPLPHQKHNPQQKKQKHNTMVPCHLPPSSDFYFKGKSDCHMLRDSPLSPQYGDIFFDGKLSILFFILLNIIL